MKRREEISLLIDRITECLNSNPSNDECKKEFFNFIEEYKKIKPFTMIEFVKYNRFNEDRLSCIFMAYSMKQIKYLGEIKLSILKENWYNALENIIELYRAYDLLEPKIYYSIIDIL